MRLSSRRQGTLGEVAAKAGLSTGNVYHHFPDKETIFQTLLNQYWADIARPDFPFNKALAIHKDHVPTLLARAEANRRGGHKKEARADYETAIKADDFLVMAHGSQVDVERARALENQAGKVAAIE